jgi:16S rRNA U516 pseudouridylate synthase RsuA-like enzyme
MTRYRIDQILSRHGYCSRGESRGWLKAGRVTINGEKAKNPAEFERVQFMKHFSDREI